MLNKALNIRSVERVGVYLLLVHSFFIGIFVACYFTYVNGAFLGLFELDVLPYAYIASGLCGYLSVLAFSRLQARVSYDRLLVVLLLFIFSLTLLFRLLALSLDAQSWLIFVMFIWAGPFLSLISLQYWGMALKLFDLRQGKRLFGIIGSGDVVSSIIGYLSMPLLLQVIGSIQLLWVGAAALLVGLLFQIIIIRRFSSQLSVATSSKKKNAKKSELDQSIFKSRYFRLIASLAVISLLGQYLVDYNFMGVLKGTFSQDQLTQFIGLFFGVIKITELLTKTLVAGRLLNNYGIRLGLSLLPVLLLIFTGIATVIHPFMEDGFMFFLLISMNKLFDKVVRRGMEEPSFKALFQPFEGEIKIAFQMRVEGAVKQLGVIVAGILLILLGLIPGFDVLQVHTAYILLAVLMVWLLLSRKTYEEYRLVLTKRLSAAEEDHQAAEVKLPFSIDLFRDHQLRMDGNLPILQLMESASPGSSLTLMSTLKERSSPEVITQIKRLNEQLLSLPDSGTNASLPAQEIRRLVRSEITEDRSRAAVQICQFQMDNCVDLLGALLKDQQVSISEILLACEVIVGDSSSRDWLIDRVLEKYRVDYEAYRPLIQSEYTLVPLLKVVFARFGSDTTLSWLVSLFNESRHEVQVAVFLMKGLSATGHSLAQTFLGSLLSDQDMEIRYWALRGLQAAGFHAQDEDVFFQYKQHVFNETAQATWLLAAMHDLQGSDACTELFSALDDQYAEVKENLFCLLAIMYDRKAVDQIRDNLSSGLSEKEALAIEMADVLLDKDLKDILFPIIDALPVSEKLKKLQLHFLQEKWKVDIRLKNIIYHDYTKVNSYVKALAIEALGQICASIPQEIIAHVYGKNLVLKEVAYITLRQKHSEVYQAHIERESQNGCAHFDKLTGQKASTIKKMKCLRQVSVFRELSHHILLKLADLHEICFLDEQGLIVLDESKENYIITIIQCDLQTSKTTGTTENYYNGEIFGLTDHTAVTSLSFPSNPDLYILCIKASEFFSLVRVYNDLANALMKHYV